MAISNARPSDGGHGGAEKGACSIAKIQLQVLRKKMLPKHVGRQNREVLKCKWANTP